MKQTIKIKNVKLAQQLSNLIWISNINAQFTIFNKVLEILTRFLPILFLNH